MIICLVVVCVFVYVVMCCCSIVCCCFPRWTCAECRIISYCEKAYATLWTAAHVRTQVRMRRYVRTDTRARTYEDFIRVLFYAIWRTCMYVRITIKYAACTMYVHNMCIDRIVEREGERSTTCFVMCLHTYPHVPAQHPLKSRQHRGERLHTRNQHLRNHRGFSVIFSNGFSGIFQHKFTSQWYCPNDCHLPSGCSLELSNGFSVASSNGTSLL